MGEVIPMESYHPSTFIREEMEARGWTLPMLAIAMHGDTAINLLALEIYMTLGEEKPEMRLGSMANGLAHAFGTSAAFLINLESAWLATQGGGNG